MQTKTNILALIMGLMLVWTAGAWAGQKPAAGEKGAATLQGPRAVFPETRYTFEPLFEGDDVTHDFVVENKGDAPLVIKNVKPG